MRTFRIRHRTSYAYERPVEFGLHRLMVRPRDGHDMRILGSNLMVEPRAEVEWAFDTFGNSVALLSFREAADELVIDSELLLRRYGFDEPLSRIARHAGAYPFRYDPDDRIDLAPLMQLQHPGERQVLEAWIAATMPSVPDGSLELLDELGGAIHQSFAYGRREVRGVQSPAATIGLGTGTCRDFALLFMEAARCLGFAARFVTGYIYDPSTDEAPAEAMTGGGSSHAWADVFIPGAGWIEFDPTNRIVACRNLLRVAATRTPSQALPVSGTYRANGGAFLGMDVSVTVQRAD